MAEENISESPQEEQLIKAGEAAKILNIARVTLYRLVDRNDIPYLKVGRVLRFRKSSLLEYIQNKEFNNEK